jgi:hypothetical protein
MVRAVFTHLSTALDLCRSLGAKGLGMPYVMLKYLTTVIGPMSFTEPDDIDRVEMLRSACLVEADIPPTLTSEDGHTRYVGAAVIHRVTDIGRRLAGRDSV